MKVQLVAAKIKYMRDEKASTIVEDIGVEFIKRFIRCRHCVVMPEPHLHPTYLSQPLTIRVMENEEVGAINKGLKMYYHVIIKPKSDKWYGEYKTDLTREQMISRYVEPYEQGKPILINGKTVSPNDIERITFHRSEKTIESYVPAIRAEDMNSPVTFIGGPSYTYKAINKSEDVTDEFISGPPGYKKELLEAKSQPKAQDPDRKKVFIVHGHDEAAKEKVARFVEKLGLEAIVLHEKASSGRTA